jgi:hypothetical protein
MMRRLVAVLATSAVAVVVQAQPASAKLPYFTVESQPASPTPGVAAQLMVHLWNDQGHRAPANWPGPAVINDLLCVFPAGHAVTGRAGCPGGLPVTLRKLDPATYAGTVTLPKAAAWMIVTFPAIKRPLPTGYPDQIALGVRAHPVGHQAAKHTAAAIWFAVALFALLAVAAFMAARRDRRGGPPRGAGPRAGRPFASRPRL